MSSRAPLTSAGVYAPDFLMIASTRWNPKPGQPLRPSIVIQAINRQSCNNNHGARVTESKGLKFNRMQLQSAGCQQCRPHGNEPQHTPHADLLIQGIVSSAMFTSPKQAAHPDLAQHSHQNTPAAGPPGFWAAHWPAAPAQAASSSGCLSCLVLSTRKHCLQVPVGPPGPHHPLQANTMCFQPFMDHVPTYASNSHSHSMHR